MHELKRLIDQIRAEYAPDPRLAVFDVRVEPGADGVVLAGQTTEPAAVAALIERIPAAGPAGPVTDGIERLPARELGSTAAALVRAAIAPLQVEPSVSAPLASQLVLGQCVDLLGRADAWYRVRVDDGYIGWIHRGYLVAGEAEWARGWERGLGGEPVVSLGGELVDDEGWTLARLPWGARLVRTTRGRLMLPDGRRGTLENGEVVDVDRMADRFPARGESVTRTARRWLGAPYLWGGVTRSGADCSGYVQAVFRMHRIPLPRDSDLQGRAGSPVPTDGGFGALRPGDLLFFAERPGRITHVAISLGGPHIIHAAISNGGVGVNDVRGDQELEERLRESFVEVRRVIPD